MGGGASKASKGKARPTRLMLHSEHAMSLPGFEKSLNENATRIIGGLVNM